MADDIPFEQTDGGNYRVLPPSGGMEPDAIEVTIGSTTYVLSGYIGKDRSKILPDTLVYRRCTVEGPRDGR